MLTIYNSMTRKKEVFKPITPGKIGMYVCGMTVYDHCHLGHARSMVCFDVIVRFLRSQNYDVTYVRNITDIDDKIIQRANDRGLTIEELTAHYIQSMHQDTKALNILSPDIEPRATAHIDLIIQLILQLIEKKFAYLSANGDVCFEVSTWKEYGKLSHKDLEGLTAGARVEIVKEKKSPLDFVLWKKAKPGEPSWSSPWGDGRPGWHIECSAMAMHELGEHFDIHGGGVDLQFPHHENEIAQSESASDKHFANYWMHVGMLQVNNEKMAKSLGNFFTIEEVLKKHHPEVIRYFLLSSHYRSALNYTEDNLHNAHKALTRLYQSLNALELGASEVLDPEWSERFNQAMNDDFNTPEALAVLFQLSHELNKTRDIHQANTMKKLANILGLLQDSPADFLQAGITDSISKEIIEQFIAERMIAKQKKDWLRADEIRKQLLEHGVELADSSEGTTWRRRT